MKTAIQRNQTDRSRTWNPESGKGGGGGFLVLVVIIGGLALLSFLSKNKPENIKTGVAESGLGFGSYYMKFEKLGHFNAADAVSSGISQAFGVGIPSEFIAQNLPSGFSGNFIVARLVSHGDAHGLGAVTDNYLLLRENSMSDCRHFIIRQGRTVGWLSKRPDENLIDFDAGPYAPDHLRGRSMIIEIMNWEGDLTVVD